MTQTRTLLSKEELMNKYNLKETKYNERMQDMRRNINFEEGYISPTHKEVWIDEVVYQKYIVYLSDKRKNELFRK